MLTVASVALGGLFVVAVVGILRVAEQPSGGSDSPQRRSPPAAQRVGAWLESAVGHPARVAAPASWREQLRGTIPGASVISYAQVRPRDVLILRPGDTQGIPSGRLQRLVRRSEPIAVFAGGVQIRRALDRLRTDEVILRRAIGRRLVADTDVRLTPRAWRTLVRGAVDRQVMAVLALVIAKGHTVDVSGFPRDRRARAAGAPARRMRVTALGGHLVEDAVSDGTGEVERMRAQLLTQPPGLVPDAVTVARSPGPAALVVTFRLRQRS